MGAAIALGDVVGERQDVFVIAVVPFKRDVDPDAVADRRDGDRVGEQSDLGAVEIFDERGDSALVIELDLLAFLMSRVGQDEADPGVEEGEFAEAVLELFKVELDDLEGGRRGEEGDLRPLLALGRGADDLERGNGITKGKAHEVFLPVTPDGEVEELAQCVDNRDTDPVETARHLVGIVVRGVLEFTAGVELGHDDLGRRDAFLGVNASWNAAAIVFDRDRSVGVELD